jgi:hypothetical protein
MLEILRSLGQPMPELPATGSRGGSLVESEAQKRRMLDAIRAAYPRLPLP